MLSPLKAVVVVISVMSLLTFSLAQVAAEEASEQGTRLIQFAQPGTPEAIVQAALVAALESNERKAFESYLALVHPSRKGKRSQRGGSGGASTKQAIEQIRRYSWVRFRKQAQDYVLPESTGGFALARTDPAKISPTTRTVRMFVAPTNNPLRTSPAPIRLERVDKGWLIVANSL